jgi:hypothetical protein
MGPKKNIVVFAERVPVASIEGFQVFPEPLRLFPELGSVFT